MTSLADEMVSVTRNLRPRTPKSEISSGREFVYAGIDDIDKIRKLISYIFSSCMEMGIFIKGLLIE